MKFKILIMYLIVSMNLLDAFDSQAGYDIEVDIALGVDPKINTLFVDQSFEFSGHWLFSLLFNFDEKNALMTSWGIGPKSTFSVGPSMYHQRLEMQYVRDRNNHRYGMGLTYHFAYQFDTSAIPVPQLSDELGYIISYNYYVKRKGRSIVSLHPQGHGNLGSLIAYYLFQIIDVKGVVYGLKYEGILYVDKLSSEKYSGSSINATFGLVF